MTISSTTSLPYSPEKVFEVLTNRNFHARVTEKFGAELRGFSVQPEEPGDGAAVLEVQRFIATEKLGNKVPDIAKKLLKSGAIINQKDTWGAFNGKERTGEMVITVAAAKVKASGTQLLRASGEQTDIITEATVKCSIPLVGSKLVEKATPIIQKVLDLQAEEIKNWIED